MTLYVRYYVLDENDDDGSPLTVCFKHAVVRVLKGNEVESHAEEESLILYHDCHLKVPVPQGRLP